MGFLEDLNSLPLIRSRRPNSSSPIITCIAIAQSVGRGVPDTPKGLTWQKWVENNKHLIGSIRTVNRMLAVGKKRNPKPVVQTKVDTTITGEYSPSDRTYHAKANVVEWSADNKIVFEMNLASHAEDPKKKKLALAIEAFRNLRIRMKKFKVWQRELDVEMKKCLAQITNKRSVQ